MGELGRLLRWMGHRRGYRRAIRAAAAAREAGDWPSAAQALARAVTLAPARAKLLVQYGHATKEAGDKVAAEAAYRLATTLAPADVDSRLHLGALLRAGGRDREASSVYAEILALDPDHREAKRAAVQLGQRNLVARQSFSRAVLAERAAQVDTAFTSVLAAVEEAAASAIVPSNFYDLFRKGNPVSPPPETRDRQVVAWVLAEDGSAAMLRRSLASLADQGVSISTTQVLTRQALLDHPVASLSSPERPLAFHLWRDRSVPIPNEGTILICTSGTIVDASAIAWLTWVADHGGADLVYADHDQLIEDWRTGPIYFDPVLYGAHDPYFLISTGALPPLLACEAALLQKVIEADPGEGSDSLIGRLMAAAAKPIHLPRLLASCYRLPPAAVSAGERDGEETGGAARAIRPACDVFPIPSNAVSGSSPSIAIVVPTHNHGAMLTRFVRTLYDRSVNPDAVRVVIVDHRSNEPETLRDLADLERQGAIVVPFDAPFNWSSASNLGARVSTDPLLVFANNDMEMMTEGWDDIMRCILRDRNVGAVGARLLYPDGTNQHAGVLFGTGSGAPTIHEGLGHLGTDPGPGGRWRATRQASAVTGAFLATRRSDFEQLGGFDQQFAIAYNDLDFCLRIREAGRSVVYCGELELIHHESVTRGRNVRAAQVAWDEVELNLFARRWGAAVLRTDPGYNPQWARDGQPFDGFREPRRAEVIARVGGKDPWLVRRLSPELISDAPRPCS